MITFYYFALLLNPTVITSPTPPSSPKKTKFEDNTELPKHVGEAS